MAVGACALAVYVWTLAPGVVAEADTPMFQFIGRVLGVAHNPGYPLYVLLGKLWTAVLPVGEVAWRLSLFSAACGGAACGVLYAVVRRAGGSTGNVRSGFRRLCSWNAGATRARMPAVSSIPAAPAGPVSRHGRPGRTRRGVRACIER